MERGEIACVEVHALSPEEFEAELPVKAADPPQPT